MTIPSSFELVFWPKIGLVISWRNNSEKRKYFISAAKIQKAV
jgi:hypothetical protein